MTDLETKKQAFITALENSGFAVSTEHSDGVHTLRLHFGRDDEGCHKLRNALLDYGVAVRAVYEADALATLPT